MAGIYAFPQTARLARQQVAAGIAGLDDFNGS
jgi:hypothetical protein